MSDEIPDEEEDVVEEAGAGQLDDRYSFSEIVFAMYVAFGLIVTFLVTFTFMSTISGGTAGLLVGAIACLMAYWFLRTASSASLRGRKVEFSILSFILLFLVAGILVPAPT